MWNIAILTYVNCAWLSFQISLEFRWLLLHLFFNFTFLWCLSGLGFFFFFFLFIFWLYPAKNFFSFYENITFIFKTIKIWLGNKTRITSQCDLSHCWIRSSQTLQPTVALIILYSTILVFEGPVMFNVVFSSVDKSEIKYIVRDWCSYHDENKVYHDEILNTTVYY